MAYDGADAIQIGHEVGHVLEKVFGELAASVERLAYRMLLPQLGEHLAQLAVAELLRLDVDRLAERHLLPLALHHQALVGAGELGHHGAHASRVRLARLAQLAQAGRVDGAAPLEAQFALGVHQTGHAAHHVLVDLGAIGALVGVAEAVAVYDLHLLDERALAALARAEQHDALRGLVATRQRAQLLVYAAAAIRRPLSATTTRRRRVATLHCALVTALVLLEKKVVFSCLCVC